MKYSPKSVANFFISLAKDQQVFLDPMKLQKLVYYANGWYAGQTGDSLLDEPIEAWPYGPVIPSLYHEFKRFGGGNISELATTFEPGSFSLVPVTPPSESNIRRFLVQVWDAYSQYTGIKLSEMTHAMGGPWDQTMKSASGMRGVDIPLELIVNHFRRAIETSHASRANHA